MRNYKFTFKTALAAALLMLAVNGQSEAYAASDSPTPQSTPRPASAAVQKKKSATSSSHINRSDRDALDELFDSVIKTPPVNNGTNHDQGAATAKAKSESIGSLIDKNSQTPATTPAVSQQKSPALQPPAPYSPFKLLPAPSNKAISQLKTFKITPLPDNLSPKGTAAAPPVSPAQAPIAQKAPATYYNSPESVPPEQRTRYSPMKSPQGLPQGGKLYNNRCDAFIDADGNYGELGQHIIKHLRPDVVPVFFDDTAISDMHRICPAFEQFTNRQKVEFWIWTLAAMAAAESSCNAKNLNANAVNGTAVGLLQLPKDWNNGHHDFYHCNAKSMADPKTNISCGIKVLYYQLTERHQLYSYHKSSAFYWAALTPKLNHHATDSIAQYQPCKATAPTTNPQELEPLPED